MSEHTAVLTKIDEQRLTLLINGKFQEVKHQFEELKQFLSEKQIQNIQYADKIYNIERIDTANFAFITGKSAFNQYLTKSIIESIQENCSAAKAFLEYAKASPDWDAQSRISNKAKEIIAYSFVGVIGKQFRQLFAFGKENKDRKYYDYIAKSLDIVIHSLDLVNFVLLSDLWDTQKTTAKSLGDELVNAIEKRFENAFAPSIMERWELFCKLLQFYKQQQFQFPISELEELNKKIGEDSAAQRCIESLKSINEKLDKEQYDLLTCFDAEKQLAHFLQHFAFLTNYKMASIKNIGYREVRNDNSIYLHRFTALGIDSKAQEDAERIIDSTDTVCTDAVLFYKGDNYKEGVNLYPFIIDYHTLIAEHGTKIYFFQSIALEDGSLEYVFVEDNSIIKIETKNDLKEDANLGDVMMDADDRMTFNLNCVVKGFEQAKKEILTDIDFV